MATRCLPRTPRPGWRQAQRLRSTSSGSPRRLLDGVLRRDGVDGESGSQFQAVDLAQTVLILQRQRQVLVDLFAETGPRRRPGCTGADQRSPAGQGRPGATLGRGQASAGGLRRAGVGGVQIETRTTSVTCMVTRRRPCSSHTSFTGCWDSSRTRRRERYSPSWTTSQPALAEASARRRGTGAGRRG